MMSFIFFLVKYMDLTLYILQTHVHVVISFPKSQKQINCDVFHILSSGFGVGWGSEKLKVA